jgi:tape measure domain-containing protein
MAGIADLNVRIGASVRDFERGMQQVERRIARFQRTFENIGTNLTQSLTLPLAALGAASVQAFGDFQSLEKAFAAVAKEGTNVGEEIERLRRIAEAPGLGFEEAVRASTRLQAVGLQAGEAARVVEQFGNAVARSGGGAAELDGAVLALTQIASKGKISAEEINQLGERIFEIRPALVQAFGTADSEQLQALGITSAEFIAKITEELAKLDRVEGGLSNAFENLRDSLRQSLTQFGNTINETFNLSEVLDKLARGIQYLVDLFASLDESTQKNILRFGIFVLAIGPVLIIVAKLASAYQLAVKGALILSGGVKKLFSAFVFLTTPIGITVGAIVALTAAAIYLYNRFEIVRKIINGLIDGFKALANLARDVAGNIAEGFRQLGQGNFREAFKAFGDAASKQSFSNIGKTFGEGFADGFEDGTNRLDGVIDSIKAKISSAFSLPEITRPGVALTTAFETDGFTRNGATGRGSGSAQGQPTPSPAPAAPREFFDIPLLQTLDLTTQAVAATTLSLGASFDQAQAAAARFRETLLSIQQPKTIVEGLGDATLAAASAFADLAAQGETNLRKLGNAALQAARQTISAFIKEGVTGIVSNILKGPIGKALGPLAVPIAGAAGGAAALLFNTLVNKISPPKLAKGGLAYAPTLATVGDNPNARIDPEVIAPLSKLRSLLDGAGGGGMVAEARISGNDLLLLVERAQLRQNRVR